MATIKDIKRMCEMQGDNCGDCPLFEWCEPMKWDENLDEAVAEWFLNHPETARKVTIGVKYRHFKGGVYTVLGVAHHSETGEELVIYQRDNDGSKNAGKICARPVGMFLSSVDKEKYPDVEQKFRFEELSEEAKLIDKNAHQVQREYEKEIAELKKYLELAIQTLDNILTENSGVCLIPFEDCKTCALMQNGIGTCIFRYADEVERLLGGDE